MTWRDIAAEYGWNSLNEHYRFPVIQEMAEAILDLRDQVEKLEAELEEWKSVALGDE